MQGITDGGFRSVFRTATIGCLFRLSELKPFAALAVGCVSETEQETENAVQSTGRSEGQRTIVVLPGRSRGRNAGTFLFMVNRPLTAAHCYPGSASAKRRWDFSTWNGRDYHRSRSTNNAKCSACSATRWMNKEGPACMSLLNAVVRRKGGHLIEATV